MNSDQIACLALLTSVVSVVISFVSLNRDKQVIHARGSIYGTLNEPSKWNLAISVSNSGKRPISIAFVIIRPKGTPGISVPFSSNGTVQIDVGNSAVTNIQAGDAAAVWSNPVDIVGYHIYVKDVFGKNHRVKI